MAIVISILALIVSIAAYFQSRKTGSIALRCEAINYVREAYTDLLEGRLNAKTSNSLREAYQLTKLVFSAKIAQQLDKLTGRAFLLDHKKDEHKTEKDWNEQRAIRDELQPLLAQMQAEAALNRWWP